MADECTWDEDGTGVYTSACGQTFYGSVNGDFDAPQDYMVHCFHCGKKIDWETVHARDAAQFNYASDAAEEQK
jgi:hypothetical protein